MQSTPAHKSLIFGAIALLLTGAAPPPVSTGDLLAGAARIDITPPPGELVTPFARVNDPVYVRTLVVESRGQRVVIIVADVPMIQAGTAAELVRRVAALAGVPQANVLISASHTHNTMRADPNPGGTILPGSAAFTARVSDAVLKSVAQSIGGLQPARLGSGKGQAYLVGAKNTWSARHGRWIEAVDRSGSGDVSRDLGVVKLETVDGKPIAFVMNYAINPVLAMTMKDAISGDVPGAASRMVEERAGNGAVALFTVGASGNPLYRPEPDRWARPVDPNRLIDAYATILAEETLATAADLDTSPDAIEVLGDFTFLVCPGKITAPLNLPDRCAYTADSKLPPCDFKDKDTDPVSLKIGVIKLGGLSIVQSDSDVSAPVGIELQKRSPEKQTWVVTTNYGPMRYVVRDADYAGNTYEATASTARRGCAETGYLRTALGMISRGN